MPRPVTGVPARRLLRFVRLLVGSAGDLATLVCGLPRADVATLARAYMVLARVEAHRGTGSTSELLRHMQALTPTRRRGPSRREAVLLSDQVMWAVDAASQCFEGARCLSVASAGFLMLARAGVPVEFLLGAAIGSSGEFGSHAWLELHGDVLHENPTVAAVYRPVVRIPARRPEPV